MAGRRSNNEGTIIKRSDGRWEVRVSFSDGKRKSFYGKTQQEVKQKLRQIQRDIDKGLPLVDEKQTVAQYLESWLEMKEHDIERTTWVRYRSQMRLHVMPTLGDIPLTKLMPSHVQHLYAQKIAEGLAPNTIYHIHTVLKSAMEDAMQHELLHRNVVALARPPKHVEREMHIFTEEQANHFLQVLSGERLKALFVLALTTGMRLGELLALRWQDVDLDKSILHVRSNLQIVERKKRLAKPKTSHSVRSIGLTRKATDVLREHYKLQQEEAGLLSFDAITPISLVFTNNKGASLHPATIESHTFPRLLRKANLPKMRFHDLRHTAATLLLARGVNVKVVSEMLGHSGVAITLRVYAHVLPHMQESAIQTMDDIFH